jgi:hypothetical protein
LFVSQPLISGGCGWRLEARIWKARTAAGAAIEFWVLRGDFEGVGGFEAGLIQSTCPVLFRSALSLVPQGRLCAFNRAFLHLNFRMT